MEICKLGLYRSYKWIVEQGLHHPIHTLITFGIGWYISLIAAVLWGFSAELGEWGVKLFDDKYAGIDQSDVIDSILDLGSWLAGPLIIYFFKDNIIEILDSLPSFL